jgi:AraC family transcriptional regulator
MQEQQTYTRLIDFYRDCYGAAVTDEVHDEWNDVSMFEVRQGPGDWSDAATQDLAIGLVTHGPVPVVCDNGAGTFSEILHPGAMSLLAPGCPSRVVAGANHAGLVLCINYGSLLALAGDDRGLPSDGCFGHLHRRVTYDRMLAADLLRMWRWQSNGRQPDRLWLDGAMLQVAAHLLRLRDGVPLVARGGLSPRHLRRAQDLMASRLAERVSMTDIAREIGLSPWHFSRAFQASTGLSPGQWLLGQRMARAAELLKDGRLPLAEVARTVGYGGLTSFGEAFRRHFGHPPSVHRRRVR